MTRTDDSEDAMRYITAGRRWGRTVEQQLSQAYRDALIYGEGRVHLTEPHFSEHRVGANLQEDTIMEEEMATDPPSGSMVEAFRDNYEDAVRRQADRPSRLLQAVEGDWLAPNIHAEARAEWEPDDLIPSDVLTMSDAELTRIRLLIKNEQARRDRDE